MLREEFFAVVVISFEFNSLFDIYLNRLLEMDSLLYGYKNFGNLGFEDGEKRPYIKLIHTYSTRANSIRIEYKIWGWEI